jgi:hypothetical protein
VSVRRDAIMPGRSSGLLEGVSESGPPVSGPTATMCNGDDLNDIAANDVDETEGIARKHVAACTATVARPCLRTRRSRLDGLTQFLTKAMRG